MMASSPSTACTRAMPMKAELLYTVPICKTLLCS